MELVVHKINGEATGKKVKLNDSIFGIEPNDHVIYLDAKQHMANKRQGTHDSRERSDIVGFVKKKLCILTTRKIKGWEGSRQNKGKLYPEGLPGLARNINDSW